MNHLLNLRNRIWVFLSKIVAALIIGLDLFTWNSIVLSHIVQIRVLILVTFPAWFFLLFESSELLVILDDIQIVLIIRLFLFFPLLLFLFFLFLLLVLFGLLFFLVVIRVASPMIGSFVFLLLVLVINDEIAFVVIIIVLLFRKGGLGLLGFVLMGSFLVFVLVCIHDLIIIFWYRSDAFKMDGLEKHSSHHFL